MPFIDADTAHQQLLDLAHTEDRLARQSTPGPARMMHTHRAHAYEDAASIVGRLARHQPVDGVARPVLAGGQRFWAAVTRTIGASR